MHGKALADKHLPHLLENKLTLEGLALSFGPPDAHDQRHLDFAGKAALLHHVVLGDVHLQPRCTTSVSS